MGKGVDVCIEPSEQPGGLSEESSRAGSGFCSSTPIQPRKLIRYETVSDPLGYLEKIVIDKNLFNGGFVTDRNNYTPFSASNWTQYRYKPQGRPPALVSESSYFAFRIGNYIGDLKGSEARSSSAVHVCKGVVPSMDYACDDDLNGIFAMKGVALIALAKNCATCSTSERAYLVGRGITYLLSTPKGGHWEIMGYSYYQRVKENLEAAGFDCQGIKNITLMRLIK
jgi:hypothetical protein